MEEEGNGKGGGGGRSEGESEVQTDCVSNAAMEPLSPTFPLPTSLLYLPILFSPPSSPPSHRKTVVVGSGYIAVELAGILNALGSDVSIVVRYNKARPLCSSPLGEK